jgi:hypothetical protein
MKRGGDDIDRDPEVRRIAQALGISGSGLSNKLCASAVHRVTAHMERFEIEPASLADVHAVVLDLTGVKVERVRDDDDLERISKRYAARQATAGVQLAFEFARNTEALVFRDDDADPRRPSFTALVDSRGERGYRAWFAERHEPAHLLIPDPSSRVAWRRTTVERPEPVEQVVDAIAARVGFWEPIVRPALDAALTAWSSVLAAFERTRADVAPGASRESSYRAFVQLVPFPLVLLRTDFGCRRGDPDNAQNSWCLRATTVLWNEAAERAGLLVWPNFRIPAHSVICDAREATLGREYAGADDLAAWRTESGRPLSNKSRYVWVTACGAWSSIELAAY